MDYMISGEEAQTLQFVLTPGKKLIIDMDSLCWASDTITIQSRGQFLARLLSVSGGIGDASNDSRVPSIIALNQIDNGKILVLNVTKSIYCFRNSFICGSEDTNIIFKQLPLKPSLMNISFTHLFNKVHFCSAITGRNNINNENKIFLQSGGTILNKELKINESLIIKFQCIIGFEATCKLSLANPCQHILYMFGGNDTYLKIEGPGNIYFCSHTSSRTLSYMMKAKLSMNNSMHANMSPFIVILNMCFLGLLFYTLSSMITKFAIDFDNFAIP